MVLVGMLAAYLAVGAMFAAWFVMVGAGRLDPAARRGSVGFRLAILPASVALWPALAWRVWRASP